MRKVILGLVVLAAVMLVPRPGNAAAAEDPPTYYKIQLTTINVPAHSTPQVRTGKYQLRIEGERRAKLKLIPKGSAAGDNSHSEWIPIASVSAPIYRTQRKCGAEDVGRRGTLKAGRKLGRQQEILVSIPGRGGCDLRATFRVDLGTD